MSYTKWKKKNLPRTRIRRERHTHSRFGRRVGRPTGACPPSPLSDAEQADASVADAATAAEINNNTNNSLAVHTRARVPPYMRLHFLLASPRRERCFPTRRDGCVESEKKKKHEAYSPDASSVLLHTEETRARTRVRRVHCTVRNGRCV